MRVLTIISGIILILGGIWCLANPGQTFMMLAWILGICMLMSGISEITAYIVGRKNADISGWILADGIITLVLSAVVLSNQLAADLVIPMVFGMWVMISGIMRMVASFELKKKGFPWVMLLIFGLLSVVVGIYGFFHPLILGLAIAILLGIFFLMQGISVLVFGVTTPSKRKLAKQASPSADAK